MGTLPAERKALLFSDAGVRLALRLSQVREILPFPGEEGEVPVRGGTVPALPVSVPLGLGGPPGRFAVVTESPSPVALRVSAVHGIVDLAEAEVFQLPALTALPRPPPFVGAIVLRGEIALELSLAALGGRPVPPAWGRPDPPPQLEAGGERELVFVRAGRSFTVPVSLLVQVLEGARLSPVPLAPAAHRGLLYHGRAIHPVFDVAALYGIGGPADEWKRVLLLDAGGTAVGVLADRVHGVGEPGAADVLRPPWDELFGA